MKKILIGGGSGLVGTRLAEMLEQNGYEVYILTRKKKPSRKYKQIVWDPMNNQIDLEGLYPDVVVNLTGAGIADKLWTNKRKKEIIDSRVKSTLLFEKLIEAKKMKPKCFISASAIGIYGDRGDEILTESSPAGNEAEFMVDCCKQWESAVDLLNQHIDRTIKLRIGVVVSTKGGALGKLSLSAKMGAAGYFGNGKQFMPWIHIDDLCKIIIRGIEEESMKGVYNAVSPNPITAKSFMHQLKSVYRKWALVLPIPGIFIKTAMGEMSKMMLNSNRVVPKRLIDSGFVFDFEELPKAISDVEERKI